VTMERTGSDDLPGAGRPGGDLHAARDDGAHRIR